MFKLNGKEQGIIEVNGRHRLITPIEAERLQDFPDDWTKYKRLSDGTIVEVSDRMRMFFMGNALVTEIVKRIADELENIISEENFQYFDGSVLI